MKKPVKNTKADNAAKTSKKKQEKLSAEDLKKILGGRNAVDPFNAA